MDAAPDAHVVAADHIEAQRSVLGRLVGGEHALDAVGEDDIGRLVETFEQALQAESERDGVRELKTATERGDEREWCARRP